MKTKTSLWGLWNIFLPASLVIVCSSAIIFNLFTVFGLAGFPRWEITRATVISILFGLMAIASSGKWLLLSIQKKKRAKIIFAGMSNC